MTAEQLIITRHGGTQPTLSVAGILDLAAVNDLVVQAIEIIHITRSTLTIDAAGITFCDAAGLGGLVNVYKAGRALGVPVRLRNPGPPLARMLTVAGLAHIFPAHDQPAANRPSVPDPGRSQWPINADHAQWSLP